MTSSPETHDQTSQPSSEAAGDPAAQMKPKGASGVLELIAAQDRETPKERELRGKLTDLRSKVRGLMGASAASAAETADKLGGLERDFLEISTEAQREDPIQTAQMGYPVLDDLRDWKEMALAMELEEPAGRAEEVLRDLIQDDVLRWKEKVLSAVDAFGPAECFETLMEATSLEVDARTRCPEYTPAADDLAEMRTALRERLRELISSSEPEEDVRDAWVADLYDRADQVLSTVDNLPPEQAADHLQIVMDDFTWHREQVETKGRRHWSLGRKLWRMRSDWQERTLQSRLENRFGARLVAFSERLILVLIILVLGILGVQMIPGLPFWAIVSLEIADAGICLVLLTEFFTKFYYAPLRWRWFGRHFLFDFIPSIPIGLIALAAHSTALMRFLPPAVAEYLPLGRLLRLFRIPLLARYVRVLRPLLRMLRATGFVIRGFDRLIRRAKPLLNRNIVLYPNREERETARRFRDGVSKALSQARSEIDDRWKHLLAIAPEEDRAAVADCRIQSLRQAREEGLARRPPRQKWQGIGREVPAEEMIDRLSMITPQTAEAELGEDLVGRIATIVRLFARPPIVWLPLLRGWLPRVSSKMTDAEVTASAGRKSGALFKWYHSLWFWAADLYGTVTPSQFVDRVGSMLVKSSARPAYRLLMFGGIYLLIQGVFWGVAFLYPETPTADPLEQAGLPPVLRWIDQFVSTVVGPTLLLLGGICLVVLGLGFWMKRLAREATDFLESAANANFLALTENIRSRNLSRDAKTLYERVLGPEWEIHQASALHDENLESFISRTRQSLLGSEMASDAEASFDAAERILLLYRDSLDGALLADSDTRTSTQLLANPALRQFLKHSARFDHKEMKLLDKLDLRRQRMPLGGPYVWFNFICRSISHAVAQLVIDYNRFAIPLEELPLASEHERQRYERWLRRDTTDTTGTEFDEETAHETVTTAFTTLHFLDNNPLRDLDVERRFGPEVVARLKRDRKLLFRRVFGTFPLHKLPKEKRVLNLYRFYEDWLAGGRVIFLPLFFGGVIARFGWQVLKWLMRSVYQLLDPTARQDQSDAAEADFTTAVRKIDRMRAPFVYASMRLRLRCDPEYLGITVPGTEQNSLAGADLEADLQFLTTDPHLRDEVEAEQRRAEADMERLSRLFENGLMQRLAARLNVPESRLEHPESYRAAAAAYLADLGNVRRYLSAVELPKDVFARTAEDDPLPRNWWPRPRLWWQFRKFWKAHCSGTRRERKAAWRAVVHNVWGVRDALQLWAAHGEEAADEGEQILADILRHPGRISEQLVTLRTVQTLSLVDVLNYRVHIFLLGDYADSGPVSEELLTWGSMAT